MSNVVVYRGHQNPVWDVQWGPMGIYFATASRDRTARLWSTDRTSCLRIYAGHLSDVDVSVPDGPVHGHANPLPLLLLSVCASIQIRCTWLLVQVIGLPACGMSNAGLAFAYSLVTREHCLH